VLAGVVVGTLLGAGTSQYAYVVAGFSPNVAKTFEQQYHNAPATNTVRYTNTRALRDSAERGGPAFLVRERSAARRDDVEFDESKYATDGPCTGMSGKRRHACEAGRN